MKQDAERDLSKESRTALTGSAAAVVAELLPEACLFDDIMSRCVFADNCTGVQVLLRTYLRRDDLTVTEARTQTHFEHFGAKSPIMDLTATDSADRRYNIEFQRAGRGAEFERMVLHGAALTVNCLPPGGEPRDLPERHVICLTARNVAGREAPIVRYERIEVVTEGVGADGRAVYGGPSQAGDVHYTYVNCAWRKPGDPVGDLNRDLFEPDPRKIKNRVLAEQLNYWKNTQEGRDLMCTKVEEILRQREARIRDEGLAEGLAKGRVEGRVEGSNERSVGVARLMLADRRPAEEIMRYSGISPADLERLRGETPGTDHFAEGALVAGSPVGDR